MRDVNWDKVKQVKSATTPFSIAVGIYVGLMVTGAAAAITVRAYDSNSMREQRSLEAMDLDKSTPDIDIAPMP